MNVLTVRYRQDAETSWWTATLPEVPEIVTQGKTLRDAYLQVRKALSLVRSDADEVELEGETDWSKRPDLSGELLAVLKTQSDLRVSALEINTRLEKATQQAVVVMEGRYSRRAAGSLLGITHSRVEQIAHADQVGESEAAWADSDP